MYMYIHVKMSAAICLTLICVHVNVHDTHSCTCIYTCVHIIYREVESSLALDIVASHDTCDAHDTHNISESCDTHDTHDTL